MYKRCEIIWDFHISDRTEYFNSILKTILNEKGLIHQSSWVNTPQQNKISERKNHNLLEVARALLFTSHVPKCFWCDAVLTSCFLINKLPSRVLTLNLLCNASDFYPENKFFSDLDLIVFGCTAFVNNHIRNKLDPRSHKCLFVGYSPIQKGYKCSSLEKWKYFVSRQVTFFEHNLISVNRVGPDALGLEQDVSLTQYHPSPDLTTLLFHPPHLHHLILAYLFLILCLYLSLPYTPCVALTPASTGSLR